MAISSLGLGSGVLTQDTLDQLRKADESARVTPIDLELALIQDEQNAFNILDAKMTNLVDSIDALKSATLYDERSATVTGTSVEVSVAANADVQDFTLNVTQLATKQVEQSGSFSSDTAKIATAAGSMNLNIDGQDFTINYDANMTLKDLKNAINDVAGTKVDATIVQVSSGDFRLFISSVDTGTTQDITITDNDGNLSDDGGTTAGGTNLTSGLSVVQAAQDAQFEFNGQAITRTSNTVTDLITGYTINLKETGSSDVSVTQNRDAIMEKIDSFIEKYNDAMSELSRLTKNSTSKDERGIFASNSTIKSMQSMIRSAMDTLGEGVGNIYEFGFDIDKDGKLSVDKTVLNAKMDENAANVEAFFSGGDYTNSAGTTTTVTGVFNELFTLVNSYTGFNQGLDQFNQNLSDQKSTLEDRRATEIERLDSKYETLAKQWAAYDSLIARLSASSNAFIQMVNTQNNTQNG